MTESSIAYIRIFRGDDGDWYYEPRGANHETLSRSEGYGRGHDAFRAVTDAYPDVEVKVEGAEPIVVAGEDGEDDQQTGWHFPE